MQQPTGNGPDGVGTILIGRQAFSSGDLDTIERVTEEMEFDLVLTPQYSLDTTFSILASGNNLNEFLAKFPLNIAPPTDDTPFYFHMLRTRDVFTRGVRNQGVMNMNMNAVAVLGVLLIFVVGLTFLSIIVPLILTSRKFSLRGSLPFFTFFSSIGLGFMLVEISQMQRLIIFLGHPIFGLSVVLFSLLLGTGLGSFLTERKGIVGARLSSFWPFVVLLAALVSFGVLTPFIIKSFESSSTFLRILASSAILFPLGIMMGMPFPIGMRVASNKIPNITPWLWGINGATSVCASVLAVVIAMTASISSSFWVGVSAYAIAFLAFIYITHHTRV